MLILLLAALSDPTAAPVTPVPPPEKCERATIHHVDNSGTASPRPLSQEPPARLEAAVAYSEGGCLKPVSLIGGKVRKLPQTR